MTKEIVFVDTETTGLLQPMGNDLEFQPWVFEFFGYRTTEKLKPIDEFHTLINIPVPIPDFISRMTGICDYDLVGKPKFEKIAKQVMKIIKNANIFIAHNATFDKGMIDIELRRIGIDDFGFPKKTVCTVEQSLYLRGYRLKQLELYEILTGKTEIKGQHRAKKDVKALVENYEILMIKGFKQRGI